MPLPARLACVGAISAGALGAIAGLVIGLVTHPPTAWFAVFEAGLPAGIAGGLLGLIAGTAGLVVSAARRNEPHRAHSPTSSPTATPSRRVREAGDRPCPDTTAGPQPPEEFSGAA
ncbi:MAG TPA: hypothetical protein VIJ51_06855 [Solirubrobacteraceae bacterium]